MAVLIASVDQAIQQIEAKIMISHLTKPRHFKSIAIWISVLMLTSSAAYGQPGEITQ